MDTDSVNFNDIFPARSESAEVDQPEPKRRSSASYVSKAVMNHVEIHNPTGGSSSALADDDLLSSVFDGLKLLDVSYSHDPQRAIKQIDDVLASEDTEYHYDDSTFFNESHRPMNIVYQHTENLHNSTTVVINTEKSMNVEAEYKPYDEHCTSKALLPDFREDSSDRLGSVDRLRSMTVDSSVSYAESRIGGFDVHGDNGTFMAEEINLHHDEVAYIRPNKVIIKSPDSIPLDSIKRSTIGMDEMLKLRQLTDEVAQFQERQRVLTEQVERERAEVEKLRLLKERRLAKEAAATVQPKERSPAFDGISVAIHANKGSLCECSEKVMISPNPYQSSNVDSIQEEEIVKISRLAEHQLKNGDIIGTIENVDMIVPENQTVKGFSSNPQICKVIVGGYQAPTEEDKTVLLFGPVGSGKTSTINSMLNYLYDVKKENNFRFVLDHPVKKTNTLVVYVINNTILPFRVTIVDTPGIVDERGNKTVSTLIKKWFEKELREAGTFRLDAVSLVLSHNENTLGWPFIYELANVKHMLGDDLKTNVLPIITNSEVLPQPTAIRSLAQANIGFLEYYKCNNLGFMPNVNGIPKLQHNLFFTHGIASLEAYFRDLQELIHPLLAVLRSGKHSLSRHSPLY